MRSAAPGTSRRNADENFAHAATGSFAHESAAADRKVRFGGSLGLEGSAQQFDAAILAEAAARHENAHHGAQSIGSRPFDERAKRNFLLVWFASLGNLQPARDRGGTASKTGWLLITICFSTTQKGNCGELRISLVLPDAAVENAATLVKKRRRHTHFTVDHLIDARVAPEVIERLSCFDCRGIGNRERTARNDNAQLRKPDEPDLLPGAVSRLNAFVPERIAQIEHLFQDLLAQAEARHKTQIEELSEHLARQNASIAETNQLLREKSLSLAKSETREDEMRKRLRQQLKATEKLCRLLDETDHAAAQLRSSARWQIANPIAALKAKLSPAQSRGC